MFPAKAILPSCSSKAAADISTLVKLPGNLFLPEALNRVWIIEVKLTGLTGGNGAVCVLMGEIRQNKRNRVRDIDKPLKTGGLF
jgi:hypothetical protein